MLVQDLATAVANNKSAPYYLRSDALAWQQAAKSLRGQNPTKRADKFKVAVRLAKKAQSYGFRGSRAGLVENLRASALLHEVLEDPKAPEYAEAMLYAGLVEQNLRELNMGQLDQYYFESCIRQMPHSDLSERCFASLETAVHEANPLRELDPQGNWAIQLRLDELRKLSEMRNVSDPPKWQLRRWEHEDPRDSGRN
ncbi:MAG: hypothetical protein HC902_08415 [Calothrix sp. SM1_5_4]|nr:hypothetical protein [Calothrix sp. SM1_5_4]